MEFLANTTRDWLQKKQTKALLYNMIFLEIIDATFETTASMVVYLA
jgi:hypothetical protein